MFLFQITVQVDQESGKPKVPWMKPKVLYPVYDVFKRTEKLDHPPGFKFKDTWFLVGEPGGTRLEWVNAIGVNYAGE